MSRTVALAVDGREIPVTVGRPAGATIAVPASELNLFAGMAIGLHNHGPDGDCDATCSFYPAVTETHGKADA